MIQERSIQGDIGRPPVWLVESCLINSPRLILYSLPLSKFVGLWYTFRSHIVTLPRDI